MISENINLLVDNISNARILLAQKISSKGVSASSSEKIFELINKIDEIQTGTSVNLQEKTFDENGTFLPDEGYDGFNKVIISVPTSGADGTRWVLNENKYIINSEGEKMCAEELYYGSTNTGVSRPSNVPYSKETPYENYSYYNTYDIIGQTQLFRGLYSMKSVMTINGELMTLNPTYSPQEYGLYEVGILKGYESDTNFKYMNFSGNTRIKECVVNAASQTADNLFKGCTNLEKATIMDCYGSSAFQQHSLSSNMFSGCTSLKEVIINNIVTNIETSAFDGCSSLTSITIPNSLTKIGSWAFRNCSSLSSITIPNSVTTINGSAFQNCSSLSGSFTFPSGVTTVGAAVLQNTSISRVVLNNVESIGVNAFKGCSKLVRIDCYSPVAPTLGESCFSGLPNNGIVNVPKDSDYSSWQDVLSNWEFRAIL